MKTESKVKTISHRLRRITLDWDFKNKTKVLIYLWKTFKYLDGRKGEQVIIKKSQSKGYHVFVWTRAKGSIWEIKEKLGSDKVQIRMDKKHKTGRQTLFNRKIKSKWRKSK